ncbi:MAG TPA: chromosome segregation protein SMC [Rhodocyclaceae bacterium]|jgi:chromosome segregation protein|nr:chromosome segregation protein SMC [Rhodocyclaceae bacterium]HNM21676.1 chromosome segregation protein SMC [Rhodocyclaceae bacterium]HNM79551.1 chromosome segregation protein SMC [Rhodocyclaceae bacterium]HNP04538.1 chromosome segregation protein SMC [Rhodocyclaceae bacterium]
MRLTKLKLAGFKSFVDPTSVTLPGQLVGVVGPNGCGKSNIMDAVRWVLGESKASELRGESMQDVIFNGTTGRKPVSRASVELIFDNSLGRALGQWSQYTELAVKRVLTRNGQSDYYINNLKVRRKDITDLFLGTGLGPRAYAIIGQGMISRIIEAKPDDLRIFLEEAAGVTRYKERRKETEGRLEDTRENLARVEDIRLELASQMEKLEAQAEVARRYHSLNDQLGVRQRVLWLLRKRDAEAERQRAALEVERATTELEGQMAALRETEARAEAAREAHFTAGETLHAAQSDMYAANAEVARLEAEIRHRRDSRRMLETRLAQLDGELAHWGGTAATLSAERLRWEEFQETTRLRVAEADERLRQQMNLAPQVEETHAQALEELNRLRTRTANGEQRLEVELTHKAHAQRALQAISQRRDKLREDAGDLAQPDPLDLAEREEELKLLREELATDQDNLATLQAEIPALEAKRKQALEALQGHSRELAAGEARRAALEQMQVRAREAGKLPEWLRRHGLADAVPLWKRIHVEAGWEDAVEAVLRERLGAIACDDPAKLAEWLHDRPDAHLTVMLPAAGGLPLGEDRLIERLRCDDPAIGAVLADWLAGVYTAGSLDAALARRTELSPGMVLVTPGGDLVSRSSVAFFAPDKSEHGLLERQREIEALSQGIAAGEEAARIAQARVSAVEGELEDKHEAIAETRQYVTDRQQRVHAVQLEVLKLTQAAERYREQRERFQDQLADLAEEEEGEREREMAADEKIAEVREGLSRIQVLVAGARSRLEEAERAVRAERERNADLDRALREAQFSLRESEGKLQDIFAQQAQAERELKRIEADRAQCAEQVEAQPPDAMEDQLQGALAARLEREQALAAARDALEAVTGALRGLEEQRQRVEIGLEPLRARIGDLKLKEQAAALSAEQFAVQLQESGVDAAALPSEVAELAATARPATLQGELTRLQNAIAELGAVNLAALQELETARERKGFLDAQAADLTEAMETLENAIRRIDRETRELLKSTFDTVNGHFGRLFPELFGGGRAELVMTGEEILDAGVQVIAQPPGKKNSTIHLLSGGEKALTAIALVFSMFQLNPAPFCLLDEVDAPLDDTNTERFCGMVRKMAAQTQFLFISHNKIAMEMAEQLVGVTMQESGVSRVVEVDIQEALKMREAA